MEKRVRLLKRDLPMTWEDFCLAIGAVALGLVLILWPDVASNVLLTCIGAVLIVCGAWQMIHYFILKGEKRLISDELATGLSLTALGFVVIVKRADFGDLLTYLFGLVLLFFSAFKLQSAFRLHYMKESKWYLELANMAVSIILGILIIFDAKLLTWMIGLFIMVEGILFLVSRIHYFVSFDRFRKGQSLAGSEA